jgi:eukaryotic-like serine/threonine-protein kinase
VDLVGQRVGNYQLVRLLGEGGMGIVYEAVHPVLGRRAAIKILKLGAGTPVVTRVVERFFNEAQLVASLGHENIVEAFDFGEVRLGEVTSYYVAMELLEGESLRARLTRGALPLGGVLAAGRQAAAALGAAHERGVVHRDVKPDNLFLARKPDGREVLKVLDFGIAKLVGDATPVPGRTDEAFTQSGFLMGTPAFMSPEQCAGRPLDARADVYALGLVLYQAATGQRAFVRETDAEVMAAQLREPPPAPTRLRPELPLAFEAVVLRALAKKPERRFASMAELQAALGRLETEPVPAPSRAELDGLMEACTATRVIDVRGAVPGGGAFLAGDGAGAGGGAGRTLPLYAPAGSEAETHTLGRPDEPATKPLLGRASGPAPRRARPDAARPGAVTPSVGSSAKVIVVSAAGFLAVAAVAVLLVPRLASTPPAARAVDAPPVVAVPAAVVPAAPVAPSSAPAALAGPAPPEKRAPAAEPRARAHLSVQVRPWAKVYVDGTLVGETPIERDLAAGAHTVLLVNDGLGKQERVPLRLQPGEKRTITRRYKASD